jgi:phage FluMu gp28-like protein
VKIHVKLYTPHPGQKPLHDSNARFRIATCGRRFGKTYAAVNEMVEEALKTPGQMTWWVAPTHEQCKIAFRLMVRHFSKVMDGKPKESPPMEIRWINGTITQFKSAKNGDNLRGEGVHFMVIDEAQDIKDEDWHASIRPTLSDKPGRAVIIGTPKRVGHWFHELFTRGRDPEWPEYESFHFRTEDNPFIPREEIEEARRSLPERIFRQEYLAEFVEGESAVFRGIRNCVKGDFEPPITGKKYRIGWDVAKHQDYSVMFVMREDTRHVVAWDRFNRVDWELQVSRLESLYRKYNKAPVLMDSTGVGDPVFDMVRKRGIKAEGYKFTNTSKEQLINRLSVAIERQEISFPEIPVLIDELVMFEYEITKGGAIRYGAPDGKNDDCVIALALATWNTLNKPTVQIFI